MMVGGDDEAVERLSPILDVLAPPPTDEHGPGWGHFGPTGAGHYVKMVHNGVEYGMMQAYAEGFSLFDACEYELDNAKIAHLWMQGSVVRSWLCELAARAFEQEGNELADIAPYVEDSGEGRWTIEDAIDRRIPTPVITASLYERFSSRGQGAFAARVNAALRNQFGGHAVVAADPAAQHQPHAE
jgi:6-phosphogluconate dehydrogenase